MSAAAELRAPRPGGFSAAWQTRDIRYFLASPALTALLLFVAILQQAAGHIDSDVSWMLTVAEKYLGGEVLYADFVEPNPPMAFLSLIPAFWLAHLAHVPVEGALVALVVCGALASIAFCGFILRAADYGKQDRWLLCNGAVFLLLISPALAFAQREQIALLAMAPMLTGLAVRQPDARHSILSRVLQGIGGAIAVAFKPYFALAIVLPALAVARREKSARVFLTLEMGSFIAASAIFAGIVWHFFPAYLSRMTPLNLAVYTAGHESAVYFLTETLAPFYVALAAALFMAARDRPLGVAATTAFWASLGFFIAFLAQRKGWINHAWPGITLLLFAWLIAWVGQTRAAAPCKPRPPINPIYKFLLAPALLAAPILFGAAQQWTDAEEFPGLRAAVEAHAPPHPRLIALSPNCSAGHPLVRRIEGEWPGHACAIWVSVLATMALERESPDAGTAAKLAEYRHQDLAQFARDVSDGRADAIVAESGRFREWATRHPELAEVLTPFEKTASAGAAEVWTRRAH